MIVRKLGFSHSRMAALAVLVLASVTPAMAQTASPPALDTAAYGPLFSTLNADIATVATGPIGLGAFGVLTIGIVFRIVWRLYKNAPKSLA